ncbi:MAG TPA: sigma factor [Phycisphaerae bacterium]|nr:sigma factor [Phycisphaerae bacterium]
MDTNQSNNPQSIISNSFTITLIRIKSLQLCRRSGFCNSDCDDLRQEMRLYLIEKAHRFDPQRGNIEAFVTNALNTWVAMQIRYRNRDKRRESYRAVSLERTPVECDGHVTSLGKVLLEEDGGRHTQTYPASPVELFELRGAIDQAIGTLTSNDQAILAHVSEHGVASAARTFGVSRRQVDNAMERIRDRFTAVGLGCD